MNPVTFDTKLVAERHTVRLRVPADQAAALGTARLLPAVVTINGHPIATTLHKVGAGYMMAVNKAVQATIGATAGDTVCVSIEPDSTPRDIAVPEDLAIALALAHAGLRATFDALTSFRRNEIVKAVTGPKKPDTRSRRIAQAVERLSSDPRPREA